ncbi:hypothetical protein D3C76_1513710 [compost metagenome]
MKLGLPSRSAQTTLDSVAAAALPNAAGMRVSAPRSSFTMVSQVMAMILPNLATLIGAPSSDSVPYLYSPCSLTCSSAAMSPSAARVTARKSGTVVWRPSGRQVCGALV